MAVLDTVTIPKIITGDVSPPASYPTGGFELDLTSEFVNLGDVKLVVETIGSLMPVHWVIEKNTDAAGDFVNGKARIKLVRVRYDKASIANSTDITGLPGGTAVQSSLFAAATTTGSDHTHSNDHDHPARSSSAPTPGGTGVATDTDNNLSNHIHSVNIPAWTGSTSSATHAHNRAFEYDHNHSVTDATTDVTLTEVANGTDLSTTVFRYLAVGFGNQ